MMDHSQCTVTTTPQWEEHVCPPCPHGLERGGTLTLRGDPRIDDAQRRLKLMAIENYSCDHPSQATALADTWASETFASVHDGQAGSS